MQTFDGCLDHRLLFSSPDGTSQCHSCQFHTQNILVKFLSLQSVSFCSKILLSLLFLSCFSSKVTWITSWDRSFDYFTPSRLTSFLPSLLFPESHLPVLVVAPWFFAWGSFMLLCSFSCKRSFCFVVIMNTEERNRDEYIRCQCISQLPPWCILRGYQLFDLCCIFLSLSLHSSKYDPHKRNNKRTKGTKYMTRVSHAEGTRREMMYSWWWRRMFFTKECVLHQCFPSCSLHYELCFPPTQKDQCSSDFGLLHFIFYDLGENKAVWIKRENQEERKIDTVKRQTRSRQIITKTAIHSMKRQTKEMSSYSSPLYTLQVGYLSSFTQNIDEFMYNVHEIFTKKASFVLFLSSEMRPNLKFTQIPSTLNKTVWVELHFILSAINNQEVSELHRHESVYQRGQQHNRLEDTSRCRSSRECSSRFTEVFFTSVDSSLKNTFYILSSIVRVSLERERSIGLRRKEQPIPGPPALRQEQMKRESREKEGM